jgi:hypothetical protein
MNISTRLPGKSAPKQVANSVRVSSAAAALREHRLFVGAQRGLDVAAMVDERLRQRGAVEQRQVGALAVGHHQVGGVADQWAQLDAAACRQIPLDARVRPG